MTNYQQRMSRFVRAGNIGLPCAMIAVWYYEIGALGWLILGCTTFLQHCLAVGLDAVYDSLKESLPYSRPDNDA
jgi:hypothetical protein